MVNLGVFAMDDGADDEPRASFEFRIGTLGDMRLTTKCERRYGQGELPRLIALRVARNVAEQLPLVASKGVFSILAIA